MNGFKRIFKKIVNVPSGTRITVESYVKSEVTPCTEEAEIAMREKDLQRFDLSDFKAN